MSIAQWLFVTGLAVILVAVTAVAVHTVKRPNPHAILGLAFAVMAVVSVVNMLILGHQIRTHMEDVEDYRDRLSNCVNTVAMAIEARDGGAKIAIPKC